MSLIPVQGNVFVVQENPFDPALRGLNPGLGEDAQGNLYRSYPVQKVSGFDLNEDRVRVVQDDPTQICVYGQPGEKIENVWFRTKAHSAIEEEIWCQGYIVIPKATAANEQVWQALAEATIARAQMTLCKTHGSRPTYKRVTFAPFGPLILGPKMTFNHNLSQGPSI